MDIGVDIIIEIMILCPIDDLSALARSCRLFHRILNDESNRYWTTRLSELGERAGCRNGCQVYHHPKRSPKIQYWKRFTQSPLEQKVWTIIRTVMTVYQTDRRPAIIEATVKAHVITMYRKRGMDYCRHWFNCLLKLQFRLAQALRSLCVPAASQTQQAARYSVLGTDLSMRAIDQLVNRLISLGFEYYSELMTIANVRFVQYIDDQGELCAGYLIDEPALLDFLTPTRHQSGLQLDLVSTCYDLNDEMGFDLFPRPDTDY